MTFCKNQALYGLKSFEVVIENLKVIVANLLSSRLSHFLFPPSPNIYNPFPTLTLPQPFAPLGILIMFKKILWNLTSRWLYWTHFIIIMWLNFHANIGTLIEWLYSCWCPNSMPKNWNSNLKNYLDQPLHINHQSLWNKQRVHFLEFSPNILQVPYWLVLPVS